MSGRFVGSENNARISAPNSAGCGKKERKNAKADGGPLKVRKIKL
jgi:hypothetical protein